MDEPITFPDIEPCADAGDIYLMRRFNRLLVMVALNFLRQKDEIAVIDEMDPV